MRNKFKVIVDKLRNVASTVYKYCRIRIICPWAMHLRNPPKKGMGLYYVVYVFILVSAL